MTTYSSGEIAQLEIPDNHRDDQQCKIVKVITQGSYIPHMRYQQKDDQKAAPGGDTLTGSKFRFRQHGETGAWMSELFPNMAKHVEIISDV